MFPLITFLIVLLLVLKFQDPIQFFLNDMFGFFTKSLIYIVPIILVRFIFDYV